MEQSTPTVQPTTPPNTTPKPANAPVLTPPKPPSLAAAINRVQGVRTPVPKTLKLGNTSDLAKDGVYFHGCIYGETSTRKTTTAAMFGSAEDVRIVMTRRKEQLRPLQNMGYKYAEVGDESSLIYALQYPEQLWPEWADRKNRVLVLDDATEAINQLLAGAQDSLEAERGGREVKDPRRTYREAGDSLRDILKIALSRPQHLVLTALAKVKDNPITGEERVSPDLPPSMMSLLTTEMEFVFYITPGLWQFTTDRTRMQVKDVVDGKEKVFSREIFAKHKLPRELSGKGIIMPNEKMDLAAIWKKVLEGKIPAAPVVPVKK